MRKINVAEVLKGCTSGMELDCTMYDDVYFDWVDELNIIHCYIQHETHKTSITFNQYGTLSSDIKSKCVIFPKGKTTWEGFKISFKNGDIVAFDSKDGAYLFIFKEYIYDHNYAQCYMMLNCNGDIDFESMGYFVERFATEEEKAKLFKAIKDNGYKWNPETKTLEKLPKFNVGDRITLKNCNDGKPIYKITKVKNDCYETDQGELPFYYADSWKLVPDKFDIKTLVPFESRVLVRHNRDNKWCGAFFSHIDEDFHSHCYKFVTTAGKSYPYCIPYVGNEHLLNTTNDCDDFYKNL